MCILLSILIISWYLLNQQNVLARLTIPQMEQHIVSVRSSSSKSDRVVQYLRTPV